jgi:hypothetical protein
MMRRMIAAGVSAPKMGTAPTGWKRLLAWRADFQNGLMGDESKREFENFAASIESIPPHQRVERVLEEGLWNRRHGPRGAAPPHAFAKRSGRLTKGWLEATPT